MVRWLLIGFLVTHGLIHIAVWVVPRPKAAKAPFDPSHSWLLGDVRGLAVALAATAGVLYVVAGVGLLAEETWWRPLTVASSGVSLGLMLLTFNPWLLGGIALDVALLVGPGWLDWPSATTLGA